MVVLTMIISLFLIIASLINIYLVNQNEKLKEVKKELQNKLKEKDWFYSKGCYLRLYSKYRRRNKRIKNLLLKIEKLQWQQQ